MAVAMQSDIVSKWGDPKDSWWYIVLKMHFSQGWLQQSLVFIYWSMGSLPTIAKYSMNRAQKYKSLSIVCMHNGIQQYNDSLDLCVWGAVVYLESMAVLTGNAVCPWALHVCCGTQRNFFIWGRPGNYLGNSDFWGSSCSGTGFECWLQQQTTQLT